MNFVNADSLTRERISITNLLQEIGQEEVIAEITAGLRAEEKYISSKYFYNRKGSILFEQITRLTEYYPTRTEKGILKRIAPGLMKRYGAHEIIELGPGDHTKVSILLSAASALEIPHIRYLPLDISQPALRNSAEELVRLYPNLLVEGYAVDFLSQFGSIRRSRPALICFFGSTIGNFEWETSLELLENISRQMKSGDILLLGMDLVKPEPLLYQAYNDARGITRAFNLNILNSVNEQLQSDFNTDDFDHRACYHKEKSRIEMYLVANRDLMVHSPFLYSKLSLAAGEAIHTENSHKYRLSSIGEIGEATGLQLKNTHTDEQLWFAIAEFQKV